MKALTGLPTSAYLKVAEQAKVPLADLLKLVPALESGLLPAYVARYRPDLSAGLDAEQLHDVLQLLRSFLDLEDRRITILTAVGRKDALTPELRAAIETASERRDLDMQDVAHTFLAGHRIMVQIQSTWFPLANRNPQTFTKQYKAGAEAYQKATHRVFMTREYPSHLELSVLE